MEFQCFLHPGEKAVESCLNCGRHYCSDCLNQVGDTQAFLCNEEICNRKYKVVEELLNDPFVKSMRERNLYAEGREKKDLVREAEVLLNDPIIGQYLKKYLKGKEIDFKIFATEFIEDKGAFDLTAPSDIDNALTLFKALKLETLKNTKDDKSNENIVEFASNDIDAQVLLTRLSAYASVFRDDMRKLQKIIAEKGKSLNYIQLILALNCLIRLELTEWFVFMEPVYESISQMTNIDKETIIKKVLIINRFVNVERDVYFENIILPILVKHLFEKFSMTFTSGEIALLIAKCTEKEEEVAELEDFEKNLGIKNVTPVIEDNFDDFDGYQFENHLNKLFSSMGYAVVNTKLSGDQGADLIISKGGIKTVVQAKNQTSPVSNVAIQQVVASVNYYAANKALVVCTSTYTKSAIELAISNNVELWDRQRLKQIVKDINMRK